MFKDPKLEPLYFFFNFMNIYIETLIIINKKNNSECVIYLYIFFFFADTFMTKFIGFSSAISGRSHICGMELSS